MAFKKGNLYTDQNRAFYDLIGFTANSEVKSNGELVMGAGNAKVVRDTYPNSAKIFGQMIKGNKVFYIKGSQELKIFAFQTKIKWRDKSHINIIEKALQKLADYANKNPDLKFALPFPGISHGGLDRKDILPLLDILPDNVDIWEFN